MVIAAGLSSPVQAFATYADVSSELPAIQELGDVGDPIYASEIPDGVYTITAKTTSRMCIMYDNYDDAEARTNKEHCLLHVSDGEMAVEFYISAAYTRLYLGSASEAASLTNEDGTDDSAYLAGDPADGYVPHHHMFAIPALNVLLEMAAFSGASVTFSQAMWYDRNAVFIPSDELIEAMNGSDDQGDDSGEEEKPDKPDKKTPSNQGGTKKPAVSDDNDDDEDDDDFVYDDDNGDSDDNDADDKGSSSNTPAGGGSGNSSSSGPGSGIAATKTPDKSSDSGSNDKNRKTAGLTGDVGKAAYGMQFIGLESKDAVEGSQLPMAQAVEGNPFLSTPYLVAYACGGLFVGGVLARILLFRRGLKFPPKKSAGQSA